MQSLTRRRFATFILASSVGTLTGCTRSDVPSTSMIGRRAPEWTLKTVDGQIVGSQAFLAEKKAYVLFFWATW